MSVTYSSTRGEESQKGLDFRTVVMTGLAHDRGLFVPDTLPEVSKEELESWRSLSYPELAVKVIAKFVKEDQVPLDVLTDIVTRSCGAFRSEDVTPVVEVGGHTILELFHGPTFAFKDVALQMLGNFFEYFLSTGSNGGRLTVLGATSGDTGSAAIYGLRGKKGVDCVILFPNGRVSEIQERQMTTVPDSNIHCVAVEGTFDDCQDLVKASFNDKAFRDRVKLGAVNSINWCRVLAQTTYYYWSYMRVTDKHPDVSEVSFSVPTGNFGDILAGYYAKQMGLPVGKLIVATNENDILHRFFSKGEYHREAIAHTISPSMDICVSSNFERYLFHLAGNDSAKLSKWMKDFETTRKLTVSGDLLKQAQSDFLSARCDTKETLRVIKQYNDESGYVLCPHAATGVSAIHQLKEVVPSMVCLATAHEAKFPAAVKRAVDPLPTPPIQLSELFHKETRRSECPNDLKVVQAFVEKKIAIRMAEDAAATKSSGSGLEKQLKRTVVVAAIIGAIAVGMQAYKRR
mmetsp:Transcript_151/g.191  ORF Transcript_151/g.191 Transcript_151/m.191 type:complete len:516 (-) Transcript_151:175-1722(-)|eukprot:CAMPEP_0195296776 /NCGR_PEP_ID=MMETSP0707-20130614/20137_1 /TAXON_ID=33640 /ORGANISM="Asterionellopsis glacialis, Strain CCMP134" /LENGTH=515 /DNA_ID=CAMNT_0040358381 /DNA_START=151 /DNA_END=1698 /DNA_ORIENTATION=-